MHRLLLLMLMATSYTVSFCQGLPSQVSLGGFQLGQYIKTADTKFGKPYLVRTTEDGWLVKAFWTSSSHEHLLVFECEGPEKDQITSIQVSGKATPGSPGIAGITLGVPESEVIKVFGTPSDRKDYEDEGVQYSLLHFPGKNYSVELNNKGLVVSVKIIGFEGFQTQPKDIPTHDPLLKAAQNGDMRAFEPLLAPNFEIYRGGKVISYGGPAAEDLMSNADIKDALLGSKGLKAALTGKGSQGDPQMRITERVVNSVIKYPNNPLLKEIVFTFYAGTWRVYEIAFNH